MIAAFKAHNDELKATVPSEELLTFLFSSAVISFVWKRPKTT